MVVVEYPLVVHWATLTSKWCDFIFLFLMVRAVCEMFSFLFRSSCFSASRKLRLKRVSKKKGCVLIHLFPCENLLQVHGLWPPYHLNLKSNSELRGGQKFPSTMIMSWEMYILRFFYFFFFPVRKFDWFEMFHLLHTAKVFRVLLIMHLFACSWMLGGYNMGIKTERNTLFLFFFSGPKS